jgi:MFS family permease
VGGLLIQALGEETGWRWIFVVNLPVGIIALIAAGLLLPTGAEGKRLSTDVFGLVLLSAALVAILVPLIQGQEEGWPLWTYLSLAGGILLIVAFAFWERHLAARGVEPLVPPHLFSHPAFTGGTILALVYFAAFTSIFFTISILWQAGLGHTALESGLVSVPFALGSIVGASQSDRLAVRLGRSVLVIGTALVAVGLIALWLILLLVPTADLTSGDLLGPLALAGLGSGMFIAPNARFIVATVDRAEAGAASGVIGTMQRIGSAIGIAVIGSVFFGNIGAIAGPADVASAFGQAATLSLAVSAAFAVAAFALVFTLPRRVEAPGRPPVMTE